VHVAGSAVVWKVVTNWPYPVRPCAPKVRRQVGSITPAKEKHELAHVVQLSGFMPNRHCHGAGASCGIVKTRAQFCMDME